jgi:methionyl-tRNA formyltransferase
MNKNIVFFGTPKIAANVLQELLKCNVNIVGVVCQPDRKSNHNKIISSDVKTFALNNNLKLFQPTKANEIVNDLIKFDIDLIITCAYGLIIPKSILEIPKFGCVNLHPSLLPKYRGPSPIQFALLNGDKKTGVTLMYMDEKMDTGNIIKQLSIEIKDNETYVSLYDKLSYLCGELITQEIDNLFNTNVYSLKQDETLATYTTKITREDEHIK